MSNNNNSLYESQIRELNKQLNDEKNKNTLLNNQIISLNAQINMYKSQLNEEKNKNQTYINTINGLNETISFLKKQLTDEKNKNKNNFQNMNQQNNAREITYINPGEKIMTINFVSQGNQDITNYSLACKNTDLFVRLEEILYHLFIRLEEKLYQDFPQFKDYETYFEVRTKRIKRFKTIEENDIRNNDVISVFRIDN